jgi:UDP-2-acetamido-2,6-beta-L-arabino-hexul-4-ose reductase
MQIVVTGGDGFIGRNLRVHLAEVGYADVVSLSRTASGAARREVLERGDFVFHLAGVNRPKDVSEFEEGNVEATRQLCDILRASGRRTPIVFSSSTQATLDNPYGRSKLAGEAAIERYGRETGAPFYVLRLANVFGKWAKPNYNSAVATFCHNVAHGLPIAIHDASAPLNLVYVDDVVETMMGLLSAPGGRSGFIDVGPVYATTVGEVAGTVQSFPKSRRSLSTHRVGTGLLRALHATYLSYLPPRDFAYGLERRADARGVFVEMLKTPDTGQFSYFTANPGVTRGGHYHHTKAEKFLVVVGSARFRFQHILTGERFELSVNGEQSRVVETVPGWAHEITNVGENEMVVLLWANEVFDPKRPDTVAFPIDS